MRAAATARSAPIGPAPARESYLVPEKILAAARQTIHYGALAQSLALSGPATIARLTDALELLMEQDTDRAPDPETKRARDSANPDVAAWDALMASFQRPLPCAPDQTWVEMERIYALSEQP